MNVKTASKEPLVTIITPTFNRAKFILESVQSVIDQDYDNVQHIIVDDGSLDNTRGLLQRYIDEGIIEYYYQENQGQSTARNMALLKARGENICFLDSDNLWLRGKLRKQVEILEENADIDVVYGDKITIDENGEEIDRTNIARYSGYIAPQMLQDNFVSMNTAMVRKRCFDEMGGIRKTRRVADDYDLWLRFSARYKFLYTPEYFAKYRVMSDQISSDKRGRFEANEQIIHDFLREFPDAVTPRQARKGLSTFYARKARYYAASGDKNTALKSIARSLYYGPIGSVAWRGLMRTVLPG